MVFGNKDSVIPERVVTDDFLIRRLSETDVELDYAAVMESKEYLRKWEQSTWPADDFTMAENLKDLQRHEGEHFRRESFTFTVMNPSETECLGCIYIFPLTAGWLTRAEKTALTDTAWEDCEAVISFWIRTSRLVEGMDQKLFDTLRLWFKDEWDFDGLLFNTSAYCEDQIGMFEAAGLQRKFELQQPKNAAKDFAFE